MSNVKAFKMVTGEEVVAELVETLSGKTAVVSDGLFSGAVTSYILRRPHTLQFQQVAPGQVGLALVPWTLSNPEIQRIEIPASAVLLSFETSANVEKQYLEQTSGISLARM